MKPENGLVDLTKLPMHSKTGAVYLNGFNGSNFKVDHRLYFSGIGTNVYYEGPQNFTYKIDKKYNDLYFKVGLEDKSENNSEIQAVVYGDGKVIYHSKFISKSDDLETIKLNVQYYSLITFELVPTKGNTTSYPVILEPKLR